MAQVAACSNGVQEAAELLKKIGKALVNLSDTVEVVFTEKSDAVEFEFLVPQSERAMIIGRAACLASSIRVILGSMGMKHGRRRFILKKLV